MSAFGMGLGSMVNPQADTSAASSFLGGASDFLGQMAELSDPSLADKNIPGWMKALSTAKFSASGPGWAVAGGGGRKRQDPMETLALAQKLYGNMGGQGGDGSTPGIMQPGAQAGPPMRLPDVSQLAMPHRGLGMLGMR